MFFDPYVLSLPFPLDAFHREPVPTSTTSKPQTSTKAIRVGKGQTQRNPNLERNGAGAVLAIG